MSAFTGRQYPGAMKDHRARKHAEAVARDAALPEDSPRRARNGGAAHAAAYSAAREG